MASGKLKCLHTVNASRNICWHIKVKKFMWHTKRRWQRQAASTCPYPRVASLWLSVCLSVRSSGGEILADACLGTKWCSKNILQTHSGWEVLTKRWHISVESTAKAKLATRTTAATFFVILVGVFVATKWENIKKREKAVAGSSVLMATWWPPTRNEAISCCFCVCWLYWFSSAYFTVMIFQLHSTAAIENVKIKPGTAHIFHSHPQPRSAFTFKYFAHATFTNVDNLLSLESPNCHRFQNSAN